MGNCNSKVPSPVPSPKSIDSDTDLKPLTEMKLVNIKPIIHNDVIIHTPQQIRDIYKDANSRMFHHRFRRRRKNHCLDLDLTLSK